MEYNRVHLPTFFYVLVWRHVVAFFTQAVESITAEDFDHSRARMDELIRNDATPKKLDAWYRKNLIDYIPERIDNIKSPEVFLRDGGGDCDDFAEFAIEVLSATGWRCRRLYLYGEGGQHVVVVADSGGKYFIMDTYACYTVGSLEEALVYFVEDGMGDYVLV